LDVDEIKLEIYYEPLEEWLETLKKHAKEQSETLNNAILLMLDDFHQKAIKILKESLEK